MNGIGRYIASGGIAGSVTALSMTLTMIGAVTSVVVSRVGRTSSRRSRALRIARTITLFLATATCLAAVFAVQGARRTAIDGIIPSHALAAGSYAMRDDAVSLFPLVRHAMVPASLSKFRVAESFLVAMDCQLFVLSALPVAGFVILLCLFFSARVEARPQAREQRNSARAGFASALLIAVPVLVTMSATLYICAIAYVDRHRFVQCLSGLCPDDMAMDRAESAFHASLARAARLFDHAETAAFVAAVLSVAIACFAKAGRDAFRSGASSRSLLLLVAALPASTTLYWLSRDLAADANTLVHPDPKRGSAYEFPGTTPTLSACQDPISQFDLVFFPTETKTNAAEIWAMDVKLHEPADYAEYASAMKRNWLLLRDAVDEQPSSGVVRPADRQQPESSPPTDTLAIVADSRLPIARIVPWLTAAIEGAGAKRIQVVSQTVTTRDAIGMRNLKSIRFCAATIRLDSQGIALSSLSTWGDLSGIAAQQDAAIQVPSGR